MSDKSEKSIWRRWWFWTALVIILIIIAGKSNKNSPDGQQAQPSSQSAPQVPATAPADEKTPLAQTDVQQGEAVAKVGDNVSVGNFAYRVNRIAFKKTVGNEFTSETADGIFLLVDLSILNTSDETRTLDNSMFTLTNLSGLEYEASSNASIALEMSGSKTLFLKQCQPNIRTSGLLIFEVPSPAERYILKVSGGFWSGKTADILLN